MVKLEPRKAGDRTAEGQRVYHEFRRCMVPTHVSLILTARAPAKVSFGVLNIDFFCAGPQTVLSKSACWQRTGLCRPTFHLRIPRLDGDWTSFISEPFFRFWTRQSFKLRAEGIRGIRCLAVGSPTPRGLQKLLLHLREHARDATISGIHIL